MMANYEQAVTDHVIDLCEEDGRPIALIQIIPAPSHLLIENVVVLPDRHGNGIGGYQCDVFHEHSILCASQI
jgi:hypothetical protein